MALPTISSRPEKTINGFLSKWNTSELPNQYVIDNTKFPINTDDSSETVTSVTDNNGYAQLNLSGATSFAAKDWITIDAGVYQGSYMVRSVEGSALITINALYDSDDSGSIVRYYNNYRVIINVYVGVDSLHPLGDPFELVGEIGQVPITDNSIRVDVRNYIKSRLVNQVPTEGNDVSSWKDFYIEFAESYDQVIDGVVSSFTSVFTSDDSNILHSTFSALQFGDENGGNMNRYVADFNKSDLAQWMTDFETPFILEYNKYTASIIINNEDTNIELEIKSFDINGNETGTQINDISFDGYGLYRLNPVYGFVNDNDDRQISIQLLDDGTPISEVLIIDIDNTCLPLFNWIDSDGSCVVDSDDSPIITL